MKELLSQSERDLLDIVEPQADLASAIRHLLDTQPGMVRTASAGQQAEWLWRKAALLDRVGAERPELVEATVMATDTRGRVLTMIDQAGGR